MNGEAPWNAGVEGEEVRRLITTDAPVLRAEAGPGTGKTFGLGRRVVRLLHPDGKNERPDAVLVVAFNRVIARELKTEVKKLLEEAGIGSLPEIRTVHALCLDALGEDLRLLLPHEREMMVYDVRHRYSQIRETYRTHNETEQGLRNHEAGHAQDEFLWRAACEWLVEHRAALISDLPTRLLDHLRGGDFEGRRYRHILVDEFQDLTAAEQQLFRRMRVDGGQLLALGDPRQSIYAFRGNDRLGLQRLTEWAAEEGLRLEDIALRSCRRCPRPIVEAANRLMMLNPAEEMIPTRDEPASIHLVHWRSPSHEAAGMAARIVEHVRNRPQGHSHLVMVTRRQFGFALREEIHQLDSALPIDVSFQEGILDCWPVREAFLFFCLLVDPDPPTWRAWFGYRAPDERGNWRPPERNAGAYRQFFLASDGEVSAEKVLGLAHEPRDRNRGSGGTLLWDRAKRYRELRQWFEAEGVDSPRALMDRVFGSPDSPFVLTAHGEGVAAQDLEVLRTKALLALEELQEDGFEGDAALRRVVRSLRHKIATREPFEPEAEARVRITTLWGAKGVTADHVYVVGLCDAAIPGQRREEYPGTEGDFVDEQRRLFYVSLTRSKETLVLSRATSIGVGEARRLGLMVAGRGRVTLGMSRFLREILPNLPDSVAGEMWDGLSRG